jgi:hypothetical protein
MVFFLSLQKLSMTSLNTTKVGGNIVGQKVHLIDGFFTCG